MPTRRTRTTNSNARNTAASSGVSQKRVLKHTQPASKQGKAKKRALPKPLAILLGIALGALLIGTLYLSWNQWLRYDDAKDIQGQWHTQSSSQVIEITDSKIVLTSDTSYDYTLDTFNKSITFTFHDLQGKGTYAFSEDRNTLVINETASDSTKTSTVFIRVGAVSTSSATASSATASGVDTSSTSASSETSESPDETSSDLSQSEVDE